MTNRKTKSLNFNPKYFTDQDDFGDYLDSLCRYRKTNPPKEVSAKEWLKRHEKLENTFRILLADKEKKLFKLKEEAVQKSEYFETYPNEYDRLLGTVTVDIIYSPKIAKLQKIIRYLKLGLVKLDIGSNGLTEEQIQSARDYPVKDLMTTPNHRGQYSCPFHDDSTPSFHIFPNNSWHCFGCGVSGQNAIDYIMKKEHLGFVDAVKFLINL